MLSFCTLFVSIDRKNKWERSKNISMCNTIYFYNNPTWKAINTIRTANFSFPADLINLEVRRKTECARKNTLGKITAIALWDEQNPWHGMAKGCAPLRTCISPHYIYISWSIMQSVNGPFLIWRWCKFLWGKRWKKKKKY